LPGYEIGITSSNKAEDKFIIRTYTDRSLGAYYHYDVTTNHLEKISDVSPWIQEDDLVEMQPVSYRSRDGITINGYLTVPKGEDQNLPVIVNPHGGPWVRDVWRYNPEVQLLASRGYSVFQMNYRGSTGYGKKFWMSSFKQWGRQWLTKNIDW